MGETRGLSEKEKKEMFVPGAKWGRKLKAGENPCDVSPIAPSKRTFEKDDSEERCSIAEASVDETTGMVNKSTFKSIKSTNN